MKATLLVEIGVEELPPTAMRRLASAFADGLAATLAAHGLDNAGVACFATPRRLAVSLVDVADEAPPTAVERKGPAIAVAFDDDGHPTAAATGFARSVGTTVAALNRQQSSKGDRLVYRATEPGRPLAELLQTCLDDVLGRLPIPKLMRWGSGEQSFVRPVHWLVALHGERVVDLAIFGCRAGRLTHGHRFHYPQSIRLDDANQYADRLYSPGYVIADPGIRRARVLDQVHAAAARYGGSAIVDAGLLDEVNALVEWPVGVAGRFDERFLCLPREVLVATLQEHQRYFPVEREDGTLANGFVTVANIESRDAAQVVAGNERVVRPRLADALFFWEQDRRHGIATYVNDLARVSFQHALGSLADKSRRVRELAVSLAPVFGADVDVVDRAATLCKTDLLTEMVGEFPELQGIMGRYYALDAGEPAAVANAIRSFYLPLRARGDIASDPAGQALALADRLDTLTGIFAIGRRPTGDKDPFALRRAALAVLRTLIEAEVALDLEAALAAAAEKQPVAADRDTRTALWTFHMERLRSYYLEQGFTGDCFQAVASVGVTDIRDFDRRIRAVSAFSKLPDARIVCAAHKRIRNILHKTDAATVLQGFQSLRLEENAEYALARIRDDNQLTIDRAATRGDYQQALKLLTRFAAPLDRFFEEVMVMTKNQALQHNRLALLYEIDRLCRRTADISCLVQS